MEEPRKVPIEVRVKDKRRVARDDEKKKASAAADAVEEEVVEGELVDAPAQPEAPEPQPDYLGDLQRLQAEFANYRKRMMAQNADAAARGEARLVERLLPVLDSFELAIAHGEAGAGVEMVFKELRSVLEAAGLEGVAGEGAPFDYHVHEAVDSHEDDSVATETVSTVHRRGYTINGTLLRPAMVGVARPKPAVPGEPRAEEAAEGAPAGQAAEE
ncbi:MAG: nucleotide exchange factor GrpE [Actinomycetota bacterium]